MRKVWRGRDDAKTKAATRARARAAAAPYLSGEKIRRYESPKMIAAHGRAPWPREKAAKDAHDEVLLWAKVNRRLPQSGATRLLRKVAGKAWSLRKANVTRDPATGKFRRRRSR
jgi:hypothetical protein